jgi:Leucine-rich repeat (LRR) protein
LKKLLFILLVLSFLVSLLLTATTSQAFTHLDDATVPLPPVSIAQTLSDVKSFSCEEVTVVPVSECEALVDFYLSTNGAGWTTNTNWLVNLDIGNWFGVTVTEGHVTILSLYSKQLSGTIPDKLGQLTYLELLDLAGNQLSGSIPESLGNLIYLEEACLTNNKLSGPIPDTLGGMTSLLRLSLNENRLTGEIPASLGNILSLQKFSVARNELTGPLPETLGQLVNVEKFEVYINNFSGELPESLGDLSNLKELVIFENSFSGSIPLSYTNLTNVVLFDFRLTDLCEPTVPEFLAWKALVDIGWHGTGQICMDYHNYLPLVCR